MSNIISLEDEIRSLRITILICAPHFQGGHSDAGARIADLFNIPFPLRMKSLAKAARKEGLKPEKLWPWWKQMRAALKDRRGR